MPFMHLTGGRDQVCISYADLQHILCMRMKEQSKHHAIQAFAVPTSASLSQILRKADW